MLKRIIVLCGFEGVALENLRLRLSSIQSEVVCARYGEGTSSYIHQLLCRLLEALEKNAKPGVKIIAILASCLPEHNQYAQDELFFPVVRKCMFPTEWKRDINKTREISTRIETLFGSDEFRELSRDFKKPVDERLLLPWTNCKSSKLLSLFKKIYRLESPGLVSSLDKEIVKLKKSGAWRIRGIDFKGAQNSPEHPIRRCSKTSYCDVAASLRFGFVVDQRFEFDVSCENGLKGKHFHQCDGSNSKIGIQCRHLNMRINGDFRVGI